MAYHELEGLVLDWAGTCVDHGSLAPVGVFVEVFRREGVDVTLQEARGPMGVHKRDHIAIVSRMPRVRQAWIDVHGAAPGEADIDRMYANATEAQIACLPDYADPIPGVVEAIAAFRRDGLKIGGTTGYIRVMLDALAPHAAAKGYAPDVAFTADEVPAGRPAPFLCWKVCETLGGTAAKRWVKVGDTPVDIEAGLNAGFWTVGVAATGNGVGMTAEALAALPAAERDALLAASRQTLRDAGAHFVVDGVATLEPVLREIDARLRRGERPA